MDIYICQALKHYNILRAHNIMDDDLDAKKAWGIKPKTDIIYYKSNQEATYLRIHDDCDGRYDGIVSLGLHLLVWVQVGRYLKIQIILLIHPLGT